MSRSPKDPMYFARDPVAVLLERERRLPGLAADSDRRVQGVTDVDLGHRLLVALLERGQGQARHR